VLSLCIQKNISPKFVVPTIQFFQTLDTLSGRLLDLKMVDWELTGRAVLLQLSNILATGA